MKKIEQRGAGAVVALLLIVVLVIVGFIGWFVYHSSMQTSDTLDSANNTSNTPTSMSKSGSVKYVAPTQTTFSKLPKALQTAVVKATTDKSPSCVKDGKLVDVDGKATDQDAWYTESGFAETRVGCDSGAASIFAKSGDNWKLVDSTQFQYSCDKLKAAKVPVEFLKTVAPGNSIKCSNGDSEADYAL